MTLKLNIDTRSWRNHIKELHEEFPGLVPVAKGNGYGFGLDVLAREAARLKDDCLAVGTAHEVAKVRDAGWSRDVIVLNPWRPFDETATVLIDDPQIITVVSRLEDLDELRKKHPRARVVAELMTSMRRHGITPEEIESVDAGSLGFEGWTMHLPLKGQLAEAKQLASAAIAHHRGAVWVSHLDIGDYRRLRTQLGVQTRMRMGTRLWLGAPQALSTTATVLDVHRITRGTRYGQRRHLARHRTVGTPVGPVAAAARRKPGAGGPGRRRILAVAVQHRGPQTPIRRAPAHACLDAVRRRLRARRESRRRNPRHRPPDHHHLRRDHLELTPVCWP